jgi:hypothetical protein
MDKSFKLFLENTEKNLRDQLKNDDLKNFAKTIQIFYPSAEKFFPAAADLFLKEHKILKLTEQMKKMSIELMKDYLNFEIQKDKVVLTKKDKTQEEHPLVDINHFIRSTTSFKDEDFGYFLLLSYFIQSLHYDSVQLFNIFLLP